MKTNKIRSEPAAIYAKAESYTSEENEILRQAIAIIDKRIDRHEPLGSPGDARNYIRMQLHDQKDEHFGVLFMDNRHRPIAWEILFHGTVDGASVHSRVLIRRALELNAAAIIVAHNHPSGVSEPSRADRALTRRIQEAGQLVDVRLLDHIVVGEGESVSFAERGWL